MAQLGKSQNGLAVGADSAFEITAGFGVYSAFIRNAFLEMLAYRLRYFTGICTYLLFVSVHYFIWSAVYANQPPGEYINGFTLAEMITYVAVGWISRSLYFSDIDETIDTLVRTGQISVYLLRPVNFQMMLLAQAFGASLFRLTFFTLPIGVVILLVFPVQLPASAGDFLLFLLATACAFLVLALLNFLVGLLAFSFKSIQGVVRAKYYLVQLLSGLLLPLSFFPDSLRWFLELLPFPLIASVPLQLYLGKIPAVQLPAVFLMQLFWIAALYLLGQFVWHRALTELTLQGG